MNKILLVLAVMLYSATSYSQATKADFIYKDTTGKVLTETQVKELAKTGFSMKKGEMENGKQVLFIIPVSAADIEKEKKEREQQLAAFINKPIADFSFTDLSGNFYNKEMLKGRIVVLNFWFVECSPCIREMPELNALVEKFDGNKDVVFLAPTFSEKPKVETFLSKNQFTYNIIPNNEDYIMKELRLPSFPTHLILDRSGVVRYASSGYEEGIDKKLTVTITELLNK